MFAVALLLTLFKGQYMALLVEGDVIKITVNGIAANQSVLNVLWYYLETLVGTVDSSLIAAQFRTMWRAVVCAPLSDTYEVNEYIVQRFSQLYQKPPTVPPSGIKLSQRFNVKHVLLGEAADAGQVAGAALPTYVAVSYARRSFGPQDTIYKPSAGPGIADNEKQFRSSMRIGPIPEDYTEAADQNVLTAAAVTALEDVGTDLMSFNVPDGGDNANFDMVIPSEWQDGIPRSSGLVSPPLAMAFQYVESMTLHPYVSSQVSRKQKLSGA